MLIIMQSTNVEHSCVATIPLMNMHSYALDVTLNSREAISTNAMLIQDQKADGILESKSRENIGQKPSTMAYVIYGRGP